MKPTLRHIETLIYYDGPELFVGVDQLGTSYLCLLVDANEKNELFLCTGISRVRLSEFRIGAIDLRRIYEAPESGELLTANIYDSNCETIELIPIEISQILPQWLPDPGFIYTATYPVNSVILQETIDRNRAIIHYSINPPESRDETKIAAETLAQGLKLFQRLLRYAYRKTLRNLNLATRNALDIPEYQTVNVFAFSNGSFTLHLESAALADGLGYAEIAKALNRLDIITANINDPEQTLEVLKGNKGHVATAYRDLLGFIVENDAPLTYEWVMPELKEPIRRSIPKSSAEVLYELLKEKENLGEEAVVIEGVVVKVDVEYGTWRILDDYKGKEFSGRCDLTTDVHLGGITVETQRYRFYCVERLEEDRGSGREKSILLLRNYEGI